MPAHPLRHLRPCALLALAAALPLGACDVEEDPGALAARGLEITDPTDVVGEPLRDPDPAILDLAGTAGGLDPTSTPDTAHLAARTGHREVVYTHDRIEVDGEVVESVESGVLDAELRARVARPWLFVDEGVVYDEVVETHVEDDGRTIRRYAIIATDIEPIEVEPEQPRPFHVDAELQNRLQITPHDVLLPVIIRVDTPRPRPLPLAPAAGRLSFDDAEALQAARREARDAREAAFAQDPVVTDVLDLIDEGRGTVRYLDGGQRIVVAALPPAVVESLIERDGVRALFLDDTISSQGSLASTRGKYQTNVQQLHDAGYNGEVGGSADTLVGVGEVRGLENEACFFDDGPSDTCDPTERLTRMFDCSSGVCGTITNFVTSEDSHGTIVSSIIAADYTQGQGGSTSIGDGHVSDWADRSTGLAKETDLHYYMLGTSSAQAARGMDCASGDGPGCRLVDVWNGSYGSLTGMCSPHSRGVGDNAAEDLFDSGALVVMSAGNNGGSDSSTTCTINSPADTPKAFAVGGLEPNGRSYDSWGRMDFPSSKYTSGRGVSARGGVSVKIGGAWRLGTSTSVDLAAIGEDVDYVTNDDGPNGTLVFNRTGTSMAAPVVAGAAASVKDWKLSKGDTWIDSPGRLHTMMLAMGDRGTAGHESHSGCRSGNEMMCGGDHLFGFGRLKVRLLEAGAGMDPVRTSMRTVTHTYFTGSVYRYTPWSGGMGAGTEMVKCVLNQYEDMSGKDDMSLISLRVRVRDKVDGSCVAGEGTIRASRYDALYDDKHHVTILDSEVNLEGRCLEVEQNRVALSSDNYVTTGTYCYAAGVLDDDSP